MVLARFDIVRLFEVVFVMAMPFRLLVLAGGWPGLGVNTVCVLL